MRRRGSETEKRTLYRKDEKDAQATESARSANKPSTSVW
jgi:hypothetical protein